jgi:opacity protein-like surface antigen
MNKIRGYVAALLTAMSIAGAAESRAQGYGAPLTVQGLDHNTLQSARSRALGGTTVGLTNDVGVMFADPAALQSLTGIQLSLGGIEHYARVDQEQQYSPLKYYSNFSLLMAGLTGSIPVPRYNDSLGILGINAGDTVQHPYDHIGPDWSRNTSHGTPMQVLLGAPFSLGGARLVAAVGVVEYADLSDYYQNNNVLSPSILDERPIPVPRPPTDSMPVVTQWSQFARSRDGSIRGYGAALSIEVTQEIAFGVSGMLLKGSSDDVQHQVARGTMTFYTNYFRLDSVYGYTTMVGNSDYSGHEFTVSGLYRGKYLSIGFSLKPPTTITRTYSMQVTENTMGAVTTGAVNGTDKLGLPWRGTLGLSIAARENLSIGLGYELRSFASAVYTRPDGTTTNPWLSSSVFHAGVEFRPSSWLALRGGMRGQSEVFEPAGNPIVGDPVSSTVYSAGVGVTFGAFHLNATYEYTSLRYQDVWGSAISRNEDTRHTIVADVAYDLPWSVGE